MLEPLWPHPPAPPSQPTGRVLAAGSRVLLEQPDGSYRPAKGQTDWITVDAIGETELAAAIATDSDDPANDPGFWQHAELVYPAAKKRVTVRLDRDVLTWFHSQGRDHL